MVVKRDRQRFCEVSGKWLGKSVAIRAFEMQPIISLAAHSHKTRGSCHQSQPGRDSIRHGESNPVATDLVLCRDGNLDVDSAELTCQIVTKLLEGTVASGLVHRTLDMESGEALGQSEFQLGY